MSQHGLHTEGIAGLMQRVALTLVPMGEGRVISYLVHMQQRMHSPMCVSSCYLHSTLVGGGSAWLWLQISH